jgi:hypothetical protein
MEHMNTSYVITGLDPVTADRLRGGDGHVYVADSHPGYPCRQCLHDADVGEELILVSHDPFQTSSPYRSTSPIFLHREPCATFVPTAEVPEQQRIRQLSVRAFDHAADMRDAALIDGADLADTLVRLFSDPTIESVHIHNAVRGCWAATAVRTPS